MGSEDSECLLILGGLLVPTVDGLFIGDEELLICNADLASDVDGLVICRSKLLIVVSEQASKDELDGYKVAIVSGSDRA